MAKKKQIKQEDQKNLNQMILEELHKLNTNLNEENKYYRRSRVIGRGIINGIFTALGATIGFAILILLLASLVRTISAVPFVNDLLQQTGIAKIIDYQLEQIQKSTTANTPTPTPSGTETPTPTATINNSQFRLENVNP